MLTVVMISHMVLHLKRSDPPVQEEAESDDMVVGSLIARDGAYQTFVSLDAWAIKQKTMSSVVGTLGNDLVHSSMSDYEHS